MQTSPFTETVFQLVEYLLKTELRTTSKNLLINYMKESHAQLPAQRAREAVERYTYSSLPRLETIAQKSKHSLTRIEHLVLQMEYAAKQVEDKTNTPG